MVPERRPFELPMSITVSLGRDKETGRAVAHVLDFDLVAVADSEDEATKKVRLAIKNYVEFGLSNGWADDIIFPAPKAFWDCLTPDTPIALMAPIYIMDRRVLVYRAESNCIAERSAVPA